MRGEHFHEDRSSMEKRSQEKLSPSMLADFCWMTNRSAPLLYTNYGPKGQNRLKISDFYVKKKVK